MYPFSVCMIVKNEEHNLKRCLEALSVLDAEIVVCDTGSTDNTVEIAKTCGVRVMTFSWAGDFSVARNFAASQAAHDLILAVDADEVLTKADLPAFSKQIDVHNNSAGMIELISPTVRDGQMQSRRERVARLYDRRYYHYSGTIHENLCVMDKNKPITYFEVPFVFLHGGYETQEQVTKKAKRDLAMLLKALETEGDTSYLHYQIGKCYVALQEKERAMAHYEKVLTLHPDDKLSYVQDMVESYGYCLLETGQAVRALSFLLSLPEHFSKHADYCFLLGLVYMNNAKFPEAVEAFQQATVCEYCAVEGCNSYRSYYNIGVIYEVLGDVAKARDWYQKCSAFEPAQARLRGIPSS